MESKSNWHKVFIGLGIMTILSGLFLISQEDYISGLSGLLVGIYLVYQNMNSNKSESYEK